jgi:predicted nucleic acid-binding protein
VEAAGTYELFLDAFPNLSLIPIDRSVLNQAARLRARYHLKTPDAIILAAALAHCATPAVTSDRGWKKVDEIEVVCLEDLAREAQPGKRESAMRITPRSPFSGSASSP